MLDDLSHGAPQLEASPAFRAFAIAVSFVGEPTPFELFSGYSRTQIDDAFLDKEELDSRMKCEAEVSGVVESFCGDLQRLGCVSAGEAGEAPGDDTMEWGCDPLFYLITDGNWVPPEGKVLWRPDSAAAPMVGSKTLDLQAYPNSKAHVCALVKGVELNEVFDQLGRLMPHHELSPWGGERTLDRLPKNSESLEDWAARIAVPASHMDALSQRLKLFDFDPIAFSFPPPSAKATPDFVVDGLLPLGDVGSLVAPGGVGKSSFAHQLLAVASAPADASSEKLFLGREVPGQFFAAFLCGEESEWYFVNRQKHFEARWPGNFIIRPPLTREQLPLRLIELASFAARVDGGRRGILVIDSVQAFIGEDDTKAHVASNFYQGLKDWAQATGWAVLVIHHTIKSAARSLTQFRSSVRGSSVHVDMPRNVFAMIDRGGNLVEFGVIKTNLPPNIAWLSEGQGILCEKQAETHTFGIVSSSDVSKVTANGTDLDRVALAIGELNAVGEVVQKSGRDGLFEKRLPSLAGLSRNFIQHAVNSLVSTDSIRVTKSGLMLEFRDGTPALEPVL